MKRSSKSSTMIFKKIILIKEYFKDHSTIILCKIIEYYNIIHQEHNKFEYVYKYISYINFDNYLLRIITDLNLNIISLSLNNKCILEYNSIIFDKFLYIISMAINFNINIKIKQQIIDNYLCKIINNGNKYDIINACLLSFSTKTNNKNIIINFDYYEGLIKCLYLSPRWDGYILYFHKKQLINKYNLKQVFIDVTKYLLIKNDDRSYNICTDLLGNKSDFIIQ